MSRRQITKSLRLLRNDLVSDIEQIITREMGRLEAVSSTPTCTCTSSPTPSINHDRSGMPDPALSTATETVVTHDQAGVFISQDLGRTIYFLVESVEDTVHAGRTGRMRTFEKHAQRVEEIITLLDNCLLSQVNLTGEPEPTN
jgi:hypothetical protein